MAPKIASKQKQSSVVRPRTVLRRLISKVAEVEPGPPLPLTEFKAWLKANAFQHDYATKRLKNLYGEFCIYTRTHPVTDGQFFRRLRAAGIERFRYTTGTRPWRYRLKDDVTPSAQSDTRARSS